MAVWRAQPRGLHLLSYTAGLSLLFLLVYLLFAWARASGRPVSHDCTFAETCSVHPDFCDFNMPEASGSRDRVVADLSDVVSYLSLSNAVARCLTRTAYSRARIKHGKQRMFESSGVEKRVKKHETR